MLITNGLILLTNITGPSFPKYPVYRESWGKEHQCLFMS